MQSVILLMHSVGLVTPAACGKLVDLYVIARTTSYNFTSYPSGYANIAAKWIATICRRHVGARSDNPYVCLCVSSVPLCMGSVLYVCTKRGLSVSFCKCVHVY